MKDYKKNLDSLISAFLILGISIGIFLLFSYLPGKKHHKNILIKKELIDNDCELSENPSRREAMVWNRYCVPLNHPDFQK